MNLRWLFGIYAEPEDAQSKRVASEASTLAHKRYVSPAKFWGFTVVAIALPAAMMFKWVLPLALDAMGYAKHSTAHTIAIAALCLMLWPWSAWVYRSLYRRPVRKALHELGHKICPECGYSLEGLAEQSVRCPECGTSTTPAGTTDEQ